MNIKKRRGFTLIELIVIILVVVILGVVAVPRLINLGEIRLHMAIRKVAQDMRYAHEYALNNNCRARIVFTGDTYSVYENSSGSWQLMKDPTTREDFTVRLNIGEYMGVGVNSVNFDGTSEVIFDSVGRPYKAGEVLLQNIGTAQLKVSVPAGEKTSNVFVDPDTGRVYLTLAPYSYS